MFISKSIEISNLMIFVFFRRFIDVLKLNSNRFHSDPDDLMQHLDQRIDGFINASENICNNNNDAAPFIQNSIGDLKRYWNDVKRQSNDLMQSIDNCKRYSSVNEQVGWWFKFLFSVFKLEFEFVVLSTDE